MNILQLVRMHRAKWITPLVLVGACLSYAWAVSPRLEPGLLSPKSGQILDLSTRQPISDAFVVVRWLKQVSDPTLIGHGGGGTDGSGCVFREVVRTDAQGRFAVPSAREKISIESNWSVKKSIRYSWDLAVYAPKHGFAQHEIHFRDAPAAIRPLDDHPSVLSSSVGREQSLESVFLESGAGPSNERADFLLTTLGHASCEPHTSDLPVFSKELYLDAAHATCAAQGEEGALQLFALRRMLSSLFSPLPSLVLQELQTIEARYPPPPPYPRMANVEDGKRICELLMVNTQDEVSQ
jgi:hypothetical protein